MFLFIIFTLSPDKFFDNCKKSTKVSAIIYAFRNFEKHFYEYNSLLMEDSAPPFRDCDKNLDVYSVLSI